MKRRELLDLLADHADELNRSEDAVDFDLVGWLADYGSTTAMPSLLALLQLAQAVKRALVPVQPSALFRSELGFRLVQEELVGKRPFPREVWWGAAAAGVVGLVLLLFRFLSGRSRSTVTAV